MIIGIKLSDLGVAMATDGPLDGSNGDRPLTHRFWAFLWIECSESNDEIVLASVRPYRPSSDHTDGRQAVIAPIGPQWRSSGCIDVCRRNRPHHRYHTSLKKAEVLEDGILWLTLDRHLRLLVFSDGEEDYRGGMHIFWHCCYFVGKGKEDKVLNEDAFLCSLKASQDARARVLVISLAVNPQEVLGQLNVPPGCPRHDDQLGIHKKSLAPRWSLPSERASVLSINAEDRAPLLFNCAASRSQVIRLQDMKPSTYRLIACIRFSCYFCNY